VRFCAAIFGRNDRRDKHQVLRRKLCADQHGRQERPRPFRQLNTKRANRKKKAKQLYSRKGSEGMHPWRGF